MAKHTTTAEISEHDKHNSSNSATYCPEDNKLRLYIGGDGRVERETYNFLRKNKWTATPKQSCSFVATWSPNAEDIAKALIDEEDEIGDEDYSPEERAADRAERFAGYRSKRAAEAHGHADTYEGGPAAFGNQNAARAERQAARHERHRGRALTQWSKAEYWHQRTAGVISNALHRSDAATRRGRILTLEAEQRRHATPGSRYHNHLTMRLIYENAMLENEGGSASAVEMVVGGWIGKNQIYKINTSPATGRVVSVNFGLNSRPRNIERLGSDVYRAPTPEELEAFNGAKKATAKTLGLINPTEDDARRLQALWNSKATRIDGSRNIGSPGTVELTTQARYTHGAKCSDWTYTTTLFEDGSAATYRGTVQEWTAAGKKIVGKLRINPSLYGVDSIVVLTDKPQKPLPIGWNTPAEEAAPAPVEEIDTTEPIEPAPLELVASAPAGCLF